MESLFLFFVQSSAGMVLFYILYWFLLRKETFYTANRYFLLASLAFAICTPLFPVQYQVIMEVASQDHAFTGVTDSYRNIPVFNDASISDGVEKWQIAWLVYLTGAAIFLLRLLIQSFSLINLLFTNRTFKVNGLRILENHKYALPFTFFNVVFVNSKFHKQEDLTEILAHEKVHIREYHWFDLLFIELLTVIFWFNPFIWFFERSIKQNHEYLADRGVLANGHKIGRYQALLVNQLMGMQVIGISNNLNFALNQNRLKMMTKKKTSVLRLSRLILILPVMAILMYAFSEPVYQVKQEVSPIEETSVGKSSTDKSIVLRGKVMNDKGQPMPGTSIVIKGTTTGTVSDIDGTFKLDVPQEATIVLSFVGKKTVTDKYATIVSSNKKAGAYSREYVMEDVVIHLYNKTYSYDKSVSPPPPPPKPYKASSDVPPPPPPAKGKETFVVVEDIPHYPGGNSALSQYVEKMQKKIAAQKNVRGKALVQFTVDGEGKVTDIKVVEKDNDQAAKGAYMLAKGLDSWTPGSQRGKSVPVKFQLPVEFK